MEMLKALLVYGLGLCAILPLVAILGILLIALGIFGRDAKVLSVLLMFLASGVGFFMIAVITLHAIAMNDTLEMTGKLMWAMGFPHIVPFVSIPYYWHRCIYGPYKWEKTEERLPVY